MKKLKPGDKVTILKSEHSDVRAGATGTIESTQLGGVAVKIKGKFVSAADTNRVVDDTRILFFKHEDIKHAKTT